jgi:hypothetical protein
MTTRFTHTPTMGLSMRRNPDVAELSDVSAPTLVAKRVFDQMLHHTCRHTQSYNPSPGNSKALVPYDELLRDLVHSSQGQTCISDDVPLPSRRWATTFEAQRSQAEFRHATWKKTC